LSFPAVYAFASSTESFPAGWEWLAAGLPYAIITAGSLVVARRARDHQPAVFAMALVAIGVAVVAMLAVAHAPSRPLARLVAAVPFGSLPPLPGPPPKRNNGPERSQIAGGWFPPMPERLCTAPRGSTGRRGQSKIAALAFAPATRGTVAGHPRGAAVRQAASGQQARDCHPCRLAGQVESGRVRPSTRQTRMGNGPRLG
jgi:hypothetical protein